MKNKYTTTIGLILATGGICATAVASGDLLIYSLITAFTGIAILGFRD